MNMRTMFLGLFVFAALSLSATGAWAQNSDSAAASSDHTAPSYDMKAQSLADLDVVQKKFVDLANALPADKMNWRPSPDARSFAEVFLHVAGERYQILALMGASIPAGFDPKAYEKSTTDRAQIVEDLNTSWEFTQKTINGMTNAEFAKLLPKLGPTANASRWLMLAKSASSHPGPSRRRKRPQKKSLRKNNAIFRD
jgi:hypothetical protein